MFGARQALAAPLLMAAEVCEKSLQMVSTELLSNLEEQAGRQVGGILEAYSHRTTSTRLFLCEELQTYEGYDTSGNLVSTDELRYAEIS